MALTEYEKSDIYNIARDWAAVNKKFKYTAIDECVAMYPEIGWTKERREFLLRELEWIFC